MDLEDLPTATCQFLGRLRDELDGLVRSFVAAAARSAEEHPPRRGGERAPGPDRAPSDPVRPEPVGREPVGREPGERADRPRPDEVAVRRGATAEFLAAIVDCSADAIVGFELDGSIASWNGGAERLYGHTAAQVLGTDGAMLLTAERRHELPAKLALIASGDSVAPYETQVLGRDRRIRDVSISLSPVLDDRGKVIGAASIARDITLQKAAEAELARQALHDPLTDLPNRSLTRDRLRLALAGAERTGRAVGLLFLDLDDFKVVNDSAGHAVGDRVLCMIAERLVHAVRPDDTVGRVGGDEFVVVCPDVSDDAEARTVADRIASAFDKPFQLDDLRFDLRLSTGVVIGGARDSADELLRKADAEMYREKELRRVKRV